MPPKKTSTAAAKSSAAKVQGPTYIDMIKDAILNLKERKGSSRPSLKKYVKANNKTAEGPTFDKLFNNALSKGVEKGLFAQPKGPSGTVKLAAKVKPEATTDEKKPSVKAATKKSTAAKKTAEAPKKAAAAAKAAPKKAAATKKAPAKVAPVKKAAATKKAAPKKAAPAPAVVDKPIILGKTKTGRVTKTTQKSAPPAAKKVTKIPAKSSKATPKKATPKKA